MAELSTPRNDPFTIVLDRLWSAVDGHRPLGDLVKSGNRVRRQDAPRAPLTSVQDADLPELDIAPTGVPQPQLWATSSAAHWIQAFEFRIHTGDQDETSSLFPIKWELLRVLYRAFVTQTGSLRSLSFVRGMRIDEVTEDPVEGSTRRGRKGWFCVFTVVVTLQFDRAKHLELDDPRMV